MVLKVVAGRGAALVVLGALGLTQFEIRSDVEINAPPDKVWKTVVDFPHDRTWNTQLSFLGGEVKPGEHYICGWPPTARSPTGSSRW